MRGKIKKVLTSILIWELTLTLFVGCFKTDNESISGADTLTSAEISKSAVTTSSSENDNYVDEKGLITSAGVKKLDNFIHKQPECEDGWGIYAGLFDFNRDEVPEIYIVKHSGGQGMMPVEVFTMDGSIIGEFKGYCRDGFCRLSYGDNCVYIHNFYEHSVHQRYDSVQKLSFKDGQINSEFIFEEFGYADDAFPLLKFTYAINNELANEKDYFAAYNQYLFEDSDLISREANEVSICAFDEDIYEFEGMTQKIADIYNLYVDGKNQAAKLFGSEPEIFAFDDYDGDGNYEAFIQQYNTSVWYFWNTDGLVKSELTLDYGFNDYTRFGSLFIAQPLGNSSPCKIFGVKNGKPYTHELSGYGMLIRNNLDLGFNRVALENGIFILRKPEFDATSPCGSHTFKPYYFEWYEGFNELVGVPVTKDDFADNAEITSEFCFIEAEGGTVQSAFLRGERYLNINYTIPIIGEDKNGNKVELAKENHYKTYMIQNSVTLIDEGRGVYNVSIKN